MATTLLDLAADLTVRPTRPRRLHMMMPPTVWLMAPDHLVPAPLQRPQEER